MGRQYSLISSPALGVLVGIMCGVLLGPLTRSLLLTPHCPDPLLTDPEQRAGGLKLDTQDRQMGETGQIDNIYQDTGDLSQAETRQRPSENPDTSKAGRHFILVGVMTARKYVDSRALAAYRTWATNIPGKVLFFTSEGTSLPEHPEVPIISLPGVDDSYPPQKKSFLMFKYMHDRFRDKFEWFVRADDDVYIKGDKLEQFLMSINSSKPQFIGQAGLGTLEEFGLLALDHNDNYCMGGPGIVMSRATLKLMAPHVSYCLKNLYTTHEDVEVGRCVRKFAQVSCTWAFEMQWLFYQNHIEPNGSYSRLKTKEVQHAITMHPFKNHTYLYRMHNHLWLRKAVSMNHRLLMLYREINAMNKLVLEDSGATKQENYEDRLGLPPSLLKFRPKSRREVLSWEFLTGKSLFSDRNANPKRGMDMPFKTALDDIQMQVMEMINKNARQRGRTIDFKEVLYGYRRVNPMYGADYILDLLLIYRKHKGRRMTVPVRRHAYLQQTFQELQFREEPLPDFVKDQTGPTISSFFQRFQERFSQFYGSRNMRENVPSDSQEFSSLMNKTINFVLPLSGRFQTFLHFMHNFEEVCLKTKEQVALALMLFHNEQDDRTTETIDYIENLRKRYPYHDLRVVQLKGAFSRGIGLQEGAKLFLDDALLFFIDVDIYVSQEALQRMRFNVIQNHQVYFPIVFSQYDPSTICDDQAGDCPQSTSPFQYGADYGYWRQFGYGIAALYKSDLFKVGGFDVSIVGWGKEDVDLYERILAKNLTIFRSVDPGMVHIFHPIVCDPQLEQAQYQMCLGSRVSTYGSVPRLAHLVYNNPDILHKNEDVEEEEAEEGAADQPKDQDDAIINEQPEKR